jgi:nitrogen fixation protein NifQ
MSAIFPDDSTLAAEIDAHAEDTGAAVYRLLVRGSDPNAADPFDTHVVACIIAVSFSECCDGQRALTDATGLDPAELVSVVQELFPQATYLLPSLAELAPVRSPDEDCLLDLLRQCASDASPFQQVLAKMVARRAQSANHLWQDLGLCNRGELSRLMARHFRPLAARNSNDMKWKKFLYRMICRDTGYAICTAPSCSECVDFEICFGDESGESRLARVRRAAEVGDVGANTSV